MRDWPSITKPKYRRAVFLDRDGTINLDTHYPHMVSELKLIPNALEAIRILADLPLDVIVASNQAGIALGHFTQNDMSLFNAALRLRVVQAGGRIDAFYFCPYLEARNLPPGTIAHECSKPSPGMLLEAAKDFELDLTRCFLVGDKTSDIAAGDKVGCFTILVDTGKAGKEEGALPVTPKYHSVDLNGAALIIRSYLEQEAAA